MTEPSAQFDARAFRTFEQSGWQAVPERYDAGFSTLTSQAASPLLDAAGVGAGMRLLDVATGPGYVAAAAAARGASVVGVDFSPAMVAQARLRFPDLLVVEGDAESLEFDADRFDAVVMNFGLLHLAQPERAIVEALRVLRPGGRFAFTVWAPPDQTIGFGIVLDAVKRHGTLDVEIPAGPPFFRFSDREECLRTLRTSGFAEAEVTTVPQRWLLRSADDLFEVMLGGTVRTAGLLRAQPPTQQAAIRTAMREAVSRYRIGGAGYELPMPAILAHAKKTQEG